MANKIIFKFKFGDVKIYSKLGISGLWDISQRGDGNVEYIYLSGKHLAGRPPRMRPARKFPPEFLMIIYVHIGRQLHEGFDLSDLR